MTTLLRTLMSKAFRQDTPVTRFLTRMFDSPPEYKFEGDEVEIDAVRENEEYAIDVRPNTGSRGNKANIFTTKKYKPPEYHEHAYVTAAELQNRLPGRTAYDISGISNSYAMSLADILVDRQLILAKKIFRAIELQCRDALFNGKIILINGDEIDFKQKAALQYSTPLAWTNSTADPFNDFEVLGGRVRQYGVKAIIDAVFGATSLSKFLNNAIVKDSAKFERIERMALTSPMRNEEGADYHGTFSAGSYKINAWTYAQYVQVPMGYGLPNEGDKVPYIPTDKIACMPLEPDFRLYYAGVPMLTNQVAPELRDLTGLGMMPAVERIDFLPYFRVDEDAEAIKIGVKSRPLAIPAGIDQFGIITVT